MVEDFDPLNGFIGGLMIGGGGILLLLCIGRIAGVSGIVGNLFTDARESAWRLAFVIGVIAAPLIYLTASGMPFPIEVTDSLPFLILGGLLVGFGTRMGSGCTSGHGVSGLGRASPRSLAATCIFILVAILTFYVTRHFLELIP